MSSINAGPDAGVDSARSSTAAIDPCSAQASRPNAVIWSTVGVKAWPARRVASSRSMVIHWARAATGTKK